MKFKFKLRPHIFKFKMFKIGFKINPEVRTAAAMNSMRSIRAGLRDKNGAEEERAAGLSRLTCLGLGTGQGEEESHDEMKPPSAGQTIKNMDKIHSNSKL